MRILYRLILLILTTGYFISCTKEPMDIETVTLSDDLYIEVTDTVTPRYTVYRLDSFATAGSNTAIVGIANDPAFGKIESRTFARIKLATNNYQTVGDDNEYFDSLVLIMRSNKNYYGDTLSAWTINVQELRQEFDATRTYYNHNFLLAQENSIGSASLIFRPNVDDSVRIVLNKSLGQEIFNLYKTGDTRIQSQDEFQKYFKGISISGKSNNVIYSFPVSDSTFFIRLYYHQDLGNITRKYIDFAAEGGSYQFNNITCDVSNTPLASLTPGKEISSDELGHQFYVNDLAGINTKITFPSAPVLATLPNYVKVSDAVLRIRPAAGSYNLFPLIPSLGMQLSNETGTTTPLYSADGTYIQNGNLVIDVSKTDQTNYSYDVAALIRTEITATPATAATASLQGYSSSLSGAFSLQRLIANDNRHPSLPSNLQIQTIFYKK